MDAVSFHERKCPEDLRAVLAQVEEKERRLVEKINRVMRMKTKLTTRKNDLNDKLKSTRTIRRNVAKELKRSTLLALAAGGEKVITVTTTAAPPKAKTPKATPAQKTKKPKATPAQKTKKPKATPAQKTKKPKATPAQKTKKPKDAASSPEKKAALSPEKKAKTKKPTIAPAPEEKKTKKIKGCVSEEDKATGGRGSAGEESIEIT